MFPKIDPQIQFYLMIATFVALAVFGLPYAIRVWNDTRQGVAEETDTPEEILTPLEAAFRSGLMTEEEYIRVRDSTERIVAPLITEPSLDQYLTARIPDEKQPHQGSTADEAPSADNP